MLRVVLGIIVGFIVWSILWIGSDAVLSTVSADWYGRHHKELEAAVNNQTPFMSDSTILIIALIRSVIFSLAAGFLAALIAKENNKLTLGLGILLYCSEFLFNQFFWNYAPLWYHISFLALLVPMTVLGGRLKKV